MQKSTVLGAAVVLWLSSTPTFASTPYVCDPDIDTHACECPSNLGAAELDSCTETTHSSLIEATDASALASYIDATWYNESGGYYLVEIDVESMPAAGVVRLGSNAGEWDDAEELRDFWRVLLDDSSLELETNFTLQGYAIYLLPPMRIRQRGASHRFNDVTSEWATRDSHNLLLDVITDENGVLTIGSNDPITLFGGDECAGTDPDSEDSAVDSDLSAEQCSATTNALIDFEDDFCETFTESCIVIVQRAGTMLQTASTLQFGTTLFCSNEDGGYECDLTEGWFTAERKQADEISITNHYYIAESFMYSDSRTEADAMEFGFGASRMNGICADGRAEEGTDVVELETQDGDYDDTATQCDF